MLDQFDDAPSHYLVLEHCNGKDLRSFVAEHGARSENEVIGIAKQLCKIMIYLHSQSPAVLHRDLTPENVMRSDDGQIQLIDFGAAHQFLEGITGTVIGKQSYIAPEQLRGQASPRSDIYSFGCTLYFLLTGHDPRALSIAVPSSQVKVSHELDELISSLTEFEETERPQSFGDVLEELNRFDRNKFTTMPVKSQQQVSELIKPPAGVNKVNEANVSVEAGNQDAREVHETQPHQSEEIPASGESLIIKIVSRSKELVE